MVIEGRRARVKQPSRSVRPT